jgi:hypothetical protein
VRLSIAVSSCVSAEPLKPRPDDDANAVQVRAIYIQYAILLSHFALPLKHTTLSDLHPLPQEQALASKEEITKALIVHRDELQAYIQETRNSLLADPQLMP